MPPPIKVVLQQHDPAWLCLAEAEADRIKAAAGLAIVEVHHIGSTAIPGLAAKPILDLLAVAVRLPELDGARHCLESTGYIWHGEHGLEGRRYCTLSDPETAVRRVQLHCYAKSDPAILRHLAFRDHLRAQPKLAHAYGREKARCAGLHPQDSHAYSDCKSAWIVRVEAEALARERRSTGGPKRTFSRAAR
jgi:GrpB-like predicted nucleotidyltransferase (UPF0157 family)